MATMDNSGYRYLIEDEKIKEYMKLTTEEKLMWLREIVEFTDMVLTEKEKEFRRKLRNCEI